MEGTPNDGTGADPPMTPIERQMQVIATSVQDLARETTRQNKEFWNTIEKGHKLLTTTANALHEGKIGRATKKLIADR